MKNVFILAFPLMLLIGCSKVVNTDCHTYMVDRVNFLGYDKVYHFEYGCKSLQYEVLKIKGVTAAYAIEAAYGLGICFAEMAEQSTIDSVDAVIFNEMSCK